MTNVKFLRDKNSNISHFEVSGHSGYADAGSDIICSAVSSAVNLVICQLSETFAFDIDYKICPEKAFFECSILESEKNSMSRDTISAILEALYIFFSDMQKQYPQFIKCNSTEV